MTNQKKGLASYDNDPQRKVVDKQGDAMYEKGSAMERGTSHEFKSEQLGEEGQTAAKASDQTPAGDPQHTDEPGQGSVPGKTDKTKRPN